MTVSSATASFAEWEMALIKHQPDESSKPEMKNFDEQNKLLFRYSFLFDACTKSGGLIQKMNNSKAADFVQQTDMISLK